MYNEGCIRKGFRCANLNPSEMICSLDRECKGCFSFKVDSVLLKDNYDNEFYIKEYIRDLNKLHEVINLRHNKGAYGEKLRLSDIKLFDNYLWLDTCGNAMSKVSKDGYSPIGIPNEEDVCPICGKKWSIYNLEDCVSTYDYKDKQWKFYHKQCNFINHLNIKQKQFTDIFDMIYPKEYTFKVIPNEYCQCDVCAPWFVFNTPDGDIKIGWRKRVINIKWLIYNAFSDKFDNEDVTKEFESNERYIHAWSIDKCIEYLNRAKNSILSR